MEELEERIASSLSDRCRSWMNSSTKERVDDDRLRFLTEYKPVFDVLLPRVSDFLKNEEPNETFPAVDIASGSAIGTVTMALTFMLLSRTTQGLSNLLWYPSDWNGPPEKERDGPVENETRASLQHLVQESHELTPLFTDQNEKPVYLRDGIELNGLKAVQFNNRRGRIRGPDPNAPGRFAVQMSMDPNDCKSFKQENISYMGGELTLHDTCLRMLRGEDKAEEFFQGLLDRTREVDILRHKTWSNVEELFGKCALVTCTSMLTCLGYRDPTAWKDTMQLASKLLITNGYLLQYDAIGYSDFGDDSVMEEFAHPLGLRLEISTIPPDSEHGSRQRKIMLWKKMETAS